MEPSFPNLSRLYDVSADGSLTPKPGDTERQNPLSKARPGLRDRLGYTLGQSVRGMLSPNSGPSRAFNNPVTGSLAGGLPAAGAAYGLARAWNYLSPSMPGVLGQLGGVRPEIAALLAGLVGMGAGGYLGHTRQTYRKQAAAMDPLQEIMMAVQMADLPPDVKFRAIQVLPTKTPGELNNMAQILGMTSGAAAGAVLMRLLFGAGGLGMLGGGLAGGMLGSRAATLFG